MIFSIDKHQNSLQMLAQKFGTPLYVYDAEIIRLRCAALQAGLAGLDYQICYAVKANDNLSIIQVLHQLGVGADVVSVGEFRRALRVGVPTHSIVFSGVGKSDLELSYAINQGVGMLAVESGSELLRVARMAHQLSKCTTIGLRFNPDIDAQTHPYISTGLRDNKFGMTRSEIVSLLPTILHSTSLDLKGLSLHIGSQITDLVPMREALQQTLDLALELVEMGVGISNIDCGGGLGVNYNVGITSNNDVPALSDYAAMLVGLFQQHKFKVTVEPGRSLVGPAGVLLAAVIDNKQTESKKFVILDAGMNDLIRPALYQAHHSATVVGGGSRAVQTVDVVGPICESGDTFLRSIDMPGVVAGDLVCLTVAGAYGAVMSSRYNARPRIAEVLIDGDAFKLIRRRETFDDMIVHELEGLSL